MSFSVQMFSRIFLTQALQNVLDNLAADGMFILAVPANYQDSRLCWEMLNPFHTCNFSIQFWMQTLERCFASVDLKLQAILCPVEVYRELPDEM